MAGGSRSLPEGNHGCADAEGRARRGADDRGPGRKNADHDELCRADDRSGSGADAAGVPCRGRYGQFRQGAPVAHDQPDTCAEKEGVHRTEKWDPVRQLPGRIYQHDRRDEPGRPEEPTGAEPAVRRGGRIPCQRGYRGRPDLPGPEAHGELHRFRAALLQLDADAEEHEPDLPPVAQGHTGGMGISMQALQRVSPDSVRRRAL